MANDVRCHDAAIAARMHEAIAATIRRATRSAAFVEVAALHVPPGLGSHVQLGPPPERAPRRRLIEHPRREGRRDRARLRRRSARHASPRRTALRRQPIRSNTNRAGGIEGGISNGAPIVVRAALKPIATTLTPQASVDLATGAGSPTNYERSDFCQVPRAVPIAEAMVAIVLADALLEKLGGDSIAEQKPRFAELRTMRREDLPMDDTPWRFGYEG
jgi:chorismate synthase